MTISNKFFWSQMNHTLFIFEKKMAGVGIDHCLCIFCPARIFAEDKKKDATDIINLQPIIYKHRLYTQDIQQLLQFFHSMCIRLITLNSKQKQQAHSNI